MQQSAGFWDASQVVDHFAVGRDCLEAYYPSERRFLTPEIFQGESLLDVGCAVGNFSRVATAHNPAIRYVGVDASPGMIARARRLHPEHEFIEIDGQTLPLEDASVDVSVCLGVLHMTVGWRRLLREMWRVTRRSIIIDLRLAPHASVEDPAVSYQKLEFGKPWDGVTVAPYIVLEVRAALAELYGLDPRPARLQTYGYWNDVSPMTVSPLSRVCMAVFKLDRPESGPVSATHVTWELPEDIAWKLPG